MAIRGLRSKQEAKMLRVRPSLWLGEQECRPVIEPNVPNRPVDRLGRRCSPIALGRLADRG